MQTDGLRAGQMKRQMEEPIDANRPFNRLTDRYAKRQLGRQTDTWKNNQAEEQMERKADNPRPTHLLLTFSLCGLLP